MFKVVYQGVEGAYSHKACLAVFPDCEPVACDDFHRAISLVEQGLADRAMIPLENSSAGRVEEIYRLLPNTSLRIIGEHFEPVNHCLLAPLGVDLADIRSVLSHPQALAQCLNNLQSLNIEPIAATDTALSAKNLARKPAHDQGAIASELAAELYGLNILKRNFQDIEGNITRFIVLANDAVLPPYDAKRHYITSLLFSVRNLPAALYKSLGGFATNGINLIKLESYMDGGTMAASHFHIDIDGHPDQAAMVRALDELGYFVKEFKLIGTYEAHDYRQQHAYV